MTSALTAWTPDDQPAVLVTPSTDGEWLDLARSYDGGGANRALARVLEVVRSRGAREVLIERRYIDQDWRSEHSHFYGTTFVRYPSVSHRLHFFSAAVPRDLHALSDLQADYLGYTVLRPLASSPVGRTMIVPPPELVGAVLCDSTEVIDLLGWALSITAMPFISQDAQFLRCAHADMWMAAYHAHLRRSMPRATSVDVYDAAFGGVIGGRQLPSDGLTVQQMMGGLTSLGFSPGLVALPQSADGSEASGWKSLFGRICRAINSNTPPIIVGNGHVWVMVGYTREASTGHPRLTLYRHDDARGPYLRVDDPFTEREGPYSTWQQMLTPFPPKIYVSAERAEATGRWWLTHRARRAPNDDPLRRAYEGGTLSFVTYGIRARDYKHGLAVRPGVDDVVARAYRRALWPRHIWVVEAQDRDRRSSGRPPVIAELIIDATAHPEPALRAREEGILAGRTPSRLTIMGPDYGTATHIGINAGWAESGR